MKFFTALIVLFWSVSTFAQPQVMFKVGVHNCPQTPQFEYYVVTSDPDLIADCRAQLDGTATYPKFVNGLLDYGNGGFNGHWSWHIVPNEWGLAELSMEVCDGLPQFVEDGLDYWIQIVRRFCCWSSYIKEEMTTTPVLDNPRPASRMSIAPNPFNPQTHISYRLDTDEVVTLRVVDPLGRCVRTLHSGFQSSGFHTVTWNGRDDAGRAVASGPFFMVLETKQTRFIQSATLLK